MSVQKKQIKLFKIIDCIAISIYLLSYILFCISLGFSWDTITYVTGLLLLFSAFYSIVSPLIRKGKITPFYWIDILFNFISLVILSSIYIATIPDDNLRSTIIAIFASCIGGLLTLYGVALTIKYSRIEKEEDELKKMKPNVFPISETTWNSLPKEKRNLIIADLNEYSEIKNTNKGDENYELFSMLLANSDISMSTIIGVLINDKLIKFKYENVLLKNSYNEILIQCKFKFEGKIKVIYLLLEDMLHNQYLAETRFELEDYKDTKLKEIHIMSVYDTKPLNSNKELYKKYSSFE